MSCQTSRTLPSEQSKLKCSFLIFCPNLCQLFIKFPNFITHLKIFIYFWWKFLIYFSSQEVEPSFLLATSSFSRTRILSILENFHEISPKSIRKLDFSKIIFLHFESKIWKIPFEQLYKWFHRLNRNFMSFDIFNILALHIPDTQTPKKLLS